MKYFGQIINNFCEIYNISQNEIFDDNKIEKNDSSIFDIFGPIIETEYNNILNKILSI